jgi:hypothetical protein
MRTLTLLAVGALLIGCAGDASEEVDASEGAATTHNDSISAPTDTGVTLAPGLWHDDQITIEHGWRMYHFTAQETGTVAFQMRADPALVHGNLWTYLRIVDAQRNNEVWAAVADRNTNLTDVLVPVEAGRNYQVIATTQNNSTANDLGKPNQSTGQYTVAAIPVDVSF